LAHEHKEIRCPRLGGPVSFRYCETTGSEGKPCFKIADCWWQAFDVVGYLKERLSPEELRQVLASRPASKLTGILAQIQQARRNIASDSEP
jgi:hypothetical protein